ncbi:MAG: alpha,6-mannosyltransferase [Cryptosporangiaceae bacterium]|jgi:alpha-1,6-mannosyltransferase|nr:alpha,6-mannosyltransferase [Cryptosporangiaceae bacterium]MDQ1656555.1 alpha,6-mannosyltransferase [Cryptosporangiaceae bacterium]
MTATSTVEAVTAPSPLRTARPARTGPLWLATRARVLDIAGATGSVLICVGAWATAYLPDGWAADAGWLNLPFIPGSAPAVIAFMVLIAGLVLLCGAWVAAGYEWSRDRRSRTDARHDQRTAWRLLLRSAWWGAPLLLAPPIASRDAWSYAALGNMVRAGVSPYQHGPAALPGNFADAVDPMWANTRSPYGPLFLDLAHRIVDFTGDSVVLGAIAMRLLAVGGLVLLAVYLPRLAADCGGSRSVAVWLVFLNPLVLVHFLGGEHNDALMMGLAVAGLAVAMRGSLWLGALLVALAVSVKVSAVIVVVAVGLVWAGQGSSRWRRIGGIALASLTCLTVLELLGRFTGLGWGWVGALQTPGTVRSWLSLPTALALSFGSLLRVAGAGNHTDGLISALRLVGAMTAAGVGAVLLVARRKPVLEATALTLLACAVLGPADQPWYLLWGGVLLAAAPLSGRNVKRLAAISIGLCAYTLTSMAPTAMGRTGQTILIVACVATGVGLFVWRRTRTGAPASEDVPHPVPAPALQSAPAPRPAPAPGGWSNSVA